MTVTSWLAGRALRLPARAHRAVAVARDLPVEMRDGTLLLADRYTPLSAGGEPISAATVLVRSPYGRRGHWGLQYGRLLAERGYVAVVQSVRGTFGSGGRFDPYAEREDGLDTVAWLEHQPWFTGVLGTLGPSYLGLTQWALAAGAGPALKACVITASASEFRGRIYPGGAFSLANGLRWTNVIERQGKRAGSPRGMLAARRLDGALTTLPLADLDRRTTGHRVAFWQEWLAHPGPGDPYWANRCFDHTLGDVTAAVSLVGGWYDIFLPWQLADFAALRRAGQSPRLTVGPWAHGGGELTGFGLREALDHFGRHLRAGEDGPAGGDRAPVRVFVTGQDRWRDLPDWPPPGITPIRWYLGGPRPGGGFAGGPGREAGGVLSTLEPEPSPPDRYRYDPADPTPAVSGPALLGGSSQPADNRQLEARPDVLTFTSGPLPADTDVVGPLQATVHVTASAGHADVFVRLCDVHPDGRSMNTADGIRRLAPGDPPAGDDGVVAVDVELSPLAHRFARGHRLRVQVSGGAFPRFARNLGSGEPLATATTLVSSEQAVFHDPGHPSSITLPVLPGQD